MTFGVKLGRRRHAYQVQACSPTESIPDSSVVPKGPVTSDASRWACATRLPRLVFCRGGANCGDARRQAKTCNRSKRSSRRFGLRLPSWLYNHEALDNPNQAHLFVGDRVRCRDKEHHRWEFGFVKAVDPLKVKVDGMSGSYSWTFVEKAPEDESPAQQMRNECHSVCNSVETDPLVLQSRKLFESVKTAYAEKDACLWRLVSLMYEQALNDDEVASLLESCPEVRWIAQCASRTPLPPGWRKDPALRVFICEATGTVCSTPPNICHFVTMAKLAVRARQIPQEALVARKWIESMMRAAIDDASRISEKWSGPHVDPDSGAEYYHCPATGTSTWENPSAGNAFIACVAQRLLQSEAFPEPDDRRCLPALQQQQQLQQQPNAETLFLKGLASQLLQGDQLGALQWSAPGRPKHPHPLNAAAERARVAASSAPVGSGSTVAISLNEADMPQSTQEEISQKDQQTLQFSEKPDNVSHELLSEDVPSSPAFGGCKDAEGDETDELVARDEKAAGLVCQAAAAGDQVAAEFADMAPDDFTKLKTKAESNTLADAKSRLINAVMDGSLQAIFKELYPPEEPQPNDPTPRETQQSSEASECSCVEVPLQTDPPCQDNGTEDELESLISLLGPPTGEKGDNLKHILAELEDDVSMDGDADQVASAVCQATETSDASHRAGSSLCEQSTGTAKLMPLPSQQGDDQVRSMPFQPEQRGDIAKSQRARVEICLKTLCLSEPEADPSSPGTLCPSEPESSHVGQHSKASSTPGTSAEDTKMIVAPQMSSTSSESSLRPASKLAPLPLSTGVAKASPESFRAGQLPSLHSIRQSGIVGSTSDVLRKSATDIVEQLPQTTPFCSKKSSAPTKLAALLPSKAATAGADCSDAVPSEMRPRTLPRAGPGWQPPPHLPVNGLSSSPQNSPHASVPTNPTSSGKAHAIKRALKGADGPATLAPLPRVELTV